MKRTKEWWSALTREQRSRLVFLERSSECRTPHPGSGLCPYCMRERGELVDAADRAIDLGMR